MKYILHSKKICVIFRFGAREFTYVSSLFDFVRISNRADRTEQRRLAKVAERLFLLFCFLGCFADWYYFHIIVRERKGVDSI